jgi:hypothetical protein
MTISNRAKAIINAPQFGLIQLDLHRPDFFQWKFSSDKKLTVSYETSSDLLRIPLMETIAYFLNSQMMSNLFTLSYREVENYLRDQNDIAALNVNDVEKIYDQLLQKLIAGFFNYHQKTFLSSSSFIEENHFWMQIFLPLEDVEFVLKEKTTLYFFNKRSDSIVSFAISE